MTSDFISYFPGEIYISSVSGDSHVCQRLVFVNSSTALINLRNYGEEVLCFSGKGWNKDVKITVEGNFVIARHPEGEVVIVTFGPNVKLSGLKNNYTAITEKGHNETNVAVSFFTTEKEIPANMQSIMEPVNNPSQSFEDNAERWNGYLADVLRDDMTEYDRVAVKSVMTLISNWKAHREGLLHDGVIPSHAVYYFVFWEHGIVGDSLLQCHALLRNWPRIIFVPCLIISSLRYDDYRLYLY